MAATFTRLVETTVDANGNLIDSKFAPPRITVSYERKVNLGNYESESCFLSMQVDPSTDEDGNSDSETAIREAFLLLKASAFEQLGIKFTVDEALVLQQVQQNLAAGGLTGSVVSSAPAPAYTPTAPSQPRSDGAAPKNKKAMWEELESNPTMWYDNREGKLNPKSPDFKRKVTGEGLWMSYNGQSAVPAGISVPDSGFANG